jgi:ADP-ribose pyrophosphatase
MLPKIITSETRYQGRAFSVRVDEVELRPGYIARLDVIEHTGAITLLPLDDAQNVWFVRQYRHPARQTLLELPAGTLNPGEAPAIAANRELQEEIGMRAGHLEELASFYLAPGYSSELMHVFLAQELSPSVQAPDEDEFLSIEKIPARQVLGLIQRGELHDAKSLATLLLAARRLGW